MSFNSDRQAVEQFFSDNFTTVPLRFEGHDYPNETPPFIGVMINPVARENDTIDNLSRVTDGFIRVRVFSFRGEGTKQVLDLCDQVITLIDNQTINTIVTYAADVPTDLNTEDAYMAKQISVPYYSIT